LSRFKTWLNNSGSRHIWFVKSGQNGGSKNGIHIFSIFDGYKFIHNRNRRQIAQVSEKLESYNSEKQIINK